MPLKFRTLSFLLSGKCELTCGSTSMTNISASSPIPNEILRLAASEIHPTPGGILPATIDPVGVFRNGPYITNLRITREVVRFRSPSAAHWVEFMKAHFGPTINAFQHSSPDAQKQLTKEMTGLIQEFNRSPNSTILSNSEYLGVVATRG